MLVINAVQEAIMSPVSNDTTETETFPLYAEQKQHSSISLQYTRRHIWRDRDGDQFDKAGYICSK